MSIYIVFSIIALGIILLLIEFLIFPGINIAGIAGTFFIIAGIVCGYYYHKDLGNYILLASITCIITLFVIAFKTKTWNKFGLKSSIDSHAPTIAEGPFGAGDTGITISRLNPMGKVLINDKIIEASSLGGYINTNTEIVVISCDKNKIYVKPKK